MWKGRRLVLVATTKLLSSRAENENKFLFPQACLTTRSAVAVLANAPQRAEGTFHFLFFDSEIFSGEISNNSSGQAIRTFVDRERDNRRDFL